MNSKKSVEILGESNPTLEEILAHFISKSDRKPLAFFCLGFVESVFIDTISREDSSGASFNITGRGNNRGTFSIYYNTKTKTGTITFEG